MSYFPSGDIPTPPSSNSPHHSCFTTPLQRQQQSGWDDAVVQNYDFQQQRQSPYTAASYYGLGLQSLPVTVAPSYLQMDMAHEQHFASPVPFAWPSQFANVQSTPMYQHPALYQQQPQLPQWDDGSCNPLSTLMPGATWGQPQSASQNITYDNSPALSEYSPRSHASVLSSPYARSDSVLRAASPQIKIEQDRGTPALQLHSPQSQPKQAVVIKPEDLTVQPTTLEDNKGRLLEPFGWDRDVRGSPVAGPSRRRASSANELRVNRKKRTYTKPDTATCSCDQCGQLFQRTYNLRAHMETHDPHRSHPYGCPADSCGKRFVRRTDLVRHEHSVHLKARDHICQLCGSGFARRDTLRRHEDDGCPKRTEVKKRNQMSRRASSASIIKRSAQPWKREDSSGPLDTWDLIPEFSA